MSECLRPDIKAISAYAQGCRCKRCKAAQSEYQRARPKRDLRQYQKEYHEKNREMVLKKQKSYYEKNKDKIAEDVKSYRQTNRVIYIVRRNDYEKRRDESTPALISGRFSKVEDQVILTHVGRIEDLARNLGRSYVSVKSRKRYLRKKGLL